MRTVRRAYLYVVCFLSMQMLGWPLILWIRDLIDQGRKHAFDPRGALDDTATLVALILVGAVLFIVHWLAVHLTKQADERNAGLRKFYLYANMTVWMGVLVIVGMDWLNVTLKVILQFKLDGYKPWADLATLLIAAILWGLHVWWGRSDRQAFTPSGRGQDLRRFYQYFFAAVGLMLLYSGLATFVSGAVQLLAESERREYWRDIMVPPISMLMIGAALTLGYWWFIQRRTHAGDPIEQNSGLRALHVHYFVLISAFSVLLPTVLLQSDLVQQALDVIQAYNSFWIRMSGSIGQLVSGVVLWLYTSWVVFRDPQMRTGGGWRRAGRRFYAYSLATVGLAMFLIGLIQVIAEILNRIAGTSEHLKTSEWLGWRIVTPCVTLVIGLALWALIIVLRYWLPQLGGAAHQERRSLWRRIYIGLFNLVGVLLLGYASVSLLHWAVRALFGAEAPDPFLSKISFEIAFLLVGGATWLAFRSLLWLDDKSWRADLIQQAFQIVVIDAENSELGQAIVRHLQSELPSATIKPASTSDLDSSALSEAQVLIGPWQIAQAPGLTNLSAQKVLVPYSGDWHWAGVETKDLEELAKHAAQAARQIADRERVHPEGRLPTYALAAMIALVLLPLWWLVFGLIVLGTAIDNVFQSIVMQLLF